MRWRFQRETDGERGAVAVFFALLLPMILAFGALVIDLGHGWENRRLLQNCVDEAALAGAYELPDEDLAEAAVLQYLETYNNGFCLRAGFFEDTTIAAPTGSPVGLALISAPQNADAYSVEVYDNDGDGSLNAVRVTMARGVSTFLAPTAATLLGGSSVDFMRVRTHAVAIKGDVNGLKGLVPLSLIMCGPGDPNVDPSQCPYVGDCPVELDKLWIRHWDPILDTAVYLNAKVVMDTDFKVTIKVGAGGDPSLENGNFQAIELGDPNDYSQNVEWGTDQWVSDCDVLWTATGNKVGPTLGGLYDDNKPNQNWGPPGNELKVSRVNRDKQPYFPAPMPANGHPDNPVLPNDLYYLVMEDTPANAHHQDEPWECPRVLFIPLIGNPGPKNGGKMQMQVLTFAVMFLDNQSIASKTGSGNNKGFIDAYFWNPEKRLLPPTEWSGVGKLDPNSWLPTGVRLVE